MRADRRRVTETDETALQPSAAVNEPYCRTSISASGQLFGRGGIRAYARIDVEGHSKAPSVVALGLSGGVDTLLAVISGLLAAAGSIGLGNLVSDVEGELVLLLSVGLGLAVGSASAWSTNRRIGSISANVSIGNTALKLRESLPKTRTEMESVEETPKAKGSKNPTSAR
jgi:hypothetical protein